MQLSEAQLTATSLLLSLRTCSIHSISAQLYCKHGNEFRTVEEIRDLRKTKKRESGKFCSENNWKKKILKFVSMSLRKRVKWTFLSVTTLTVTFLVPVIEWSKGHDLGEVMVVGLRLFLM